MSYSRVQFYFAEDVALALREHDIDAWFDVHRLQPGDDWSAEIETALRASEAVVLVASRESLRSPHVQAEVNLARELDLRVVVVMAEPVTLPAPLAGMPCLDLRRGFQRKLGALVDGLRGGPIAVTRGGQAGVIRMLLFVLIAGAALNTVIAVSILSSFSSTTNPLGAFIWVMMVPFCGWLAWEVAHRKPKRVLMLLAVVVGGAVVGAVIVIGALLFLVESTETSHVVVALLVLLLGVAMIVPPVWVLRSPAFYRWCPTGSAPRWLRRRMLARRGYYGTPTPGEAGPISYALHTTDADISVRDALDAELRSRNHRPVTAGVAADRNICIVSDLTPRSWLEDTLARLDGRVILVISAAVALDALRNVERYQWVDYRRRRQGTLTGLAARIGSSRVAVDDALVPESLASRVLPLRVFLLCGAYLGATASVLAVGVTTLVGADLSGVYGDPPSPLVTIPAVLLAAALPAYTATVLATRQVSRRKFLAVFVVTVLTLVAFERLMYPAAKLWVVSAPALFGTVYLAAAWRTLANWLPRWSADRQVPRLALTTQRGWRRPAARRTVVAILALIVFYGFAAASVGRREATAPPPSAQVVVGSGYRLTRPNEWQDVTTQASARDGVTYDFVFRRGESAFYVSHTRAVGDAEQIAQQVQDAITRTRGAILDASGPLALDGEEQTVCFGFSEGDNAQRSRGEQVVVVRGEVVYLVTLAAPGDSYSRTLFEPLLRGWHWAG